MTETRDIYCGSGKEYVFENGGSINSLSICLDDIPKEFIKEAKNGKRYINLKLGSKRGGKDQYGNTHWIKVDTWKPKEESGRVVDVKEDGLPF